MIKIERVMNMSSKDNSLIEIAVELLQKKQRPQNINSIIKEVMSIKGIKAAEVSSHAPQFVMDFMLSGYFVYCGDDCWDLKDRQPTSILDKDGHVYESIFEEDEDVKKNELKDEDIYGPIGKDDDEDEDNDDDDDENEEDEDGDEDDLSSEFEEHFDEEELDVGLLEEGDLEGGVVSVSDSLLRLTEKETFSPSLVQMMFPCMSVLNTFTSASRKRLSVASVGWP